MEQERTLEALARALGDIAPADLIDKHEAAEIAGLSYHSLRSRSGDYVGFWLLGYSDTSPSAYRRDWCEAYKAWRAKPPSKRGGKFLIEGVANAYGEQPWPAIPVQTRAIGAGEILVLLDRWKYGELHRRVEAIFARQLASAELASLIARNSAEWKLLFDETGTVRPFEEVRDAVEAKTAELLLPPDVVERREVFAGDTKWHRETLLHMHWIDVVQQEKAWLGTRKKALLRSRAP